MTLRRAMFARLAKTNAFSSPITLGSNLAALLAGLRSTMGLPDSDVEGLANESAWNTLVMGALYPSNVSRLDNATALAANGSPALLDANRSAAAAAAASAAARKEERKMRSMLMLFAFRRG